MGTVEVQEREDGYAIVVQRTVAAPLDAAYAAWTQPEHLNRWFTTGAEVDLRPGGRYSNADNDAGTYTVVDHDRIRFTWEQAEHGEGSEVEVRFDARGERTVVTLTHEKLATREDAEDLSTGGWDWAMDSYRQYLETGQSLPYNEWKALR